MRKPALPLLAVVALAGCGSSPAEPSPKLPAGAAASLSDDLTAVRQASTTGDRDAALRALATFSSDVEGLSDVLPTVQLRRLRISIARTRARIEAELAPDATTTSVPATTTATPPATATPAAPAPATVAPGPGRGKGKGRDKPGKGGPKKDKGPKDTMEGDG